MLTDNKQTKKRRQNSQKENYFIDEKLALQDGRLTN